MEMAPNMISQWRSPLESWTPYATDDLRRDYLVTVDCEQHQRKDIPIKGHSNTDTTLDMIGHVPLLRLVQF
jgi:hypothetical protein